MPTIVFLYQLSEADEARVRQKAAGWNIVHGKSPDHWLAELPNAEIVVGWKKEAAEVVLQAGSQVKWIQAVSAGVDKMPLEALKAKGILLTTASGVHPNPISETVFAMMLAWTRKLHMYIRNQQSSIWDHSGLRMELHGKTLLIAGVGAIGSEIARIAKAFDMQVIGIRRSGAAAPNIDIMTTLDRMSDHLPEADYIVNLLPNTGETHHVFDRRAFQAMKPTAFFVNVGRGATVDTEALVEALRERTIGGAGLDVFEQEPLPPDHPLWRMEEVIVTPHTAGSTERYYERVMDIFLRNFDSYSRGEPPTLNLVKYDLAY
jgi:phosphoglycerate dehydrogenase-like enzyme